MLIIIKTIKTYRLIKNQKNYGYAEGNNKGLKHVKGEYALICNNDLVLDENLIANLVKTAKENSADIVVPKLMFLNKPGYINNAGSEIVVDSDWPVSETGYNEKDIGQYDSVREISAFCGACVLIKRTFLETVGLFDRRFFMYFEDADLSWRGKKLEKNTYMHRRQLHIMFIPAPARRDLLFSIILSVETGCLYLPKRKNFYISERLIENNS